MTLLRTNVEENREIGRRLAAAANAAIGPVAILIPKRGVSLLDREGGAFWDPEADRACFDAIRTGVRPGIPVAHMPGIDGFFGASSIERLPTERAITSQVKAFKESRLA